VNPTTRIPSRQDPPHGEGRHHLAQIRRPGSHLRAKHGPTRLPFLAALRGTRQVRLPSIRPRPVIGSRARRPASGPRSPARIALRSWLGQDAAPISLAPGKVRVDRSSDSAKIDVRKSNPGASTRPGSSQPTRGRGETRIRAPTSLSRSPLFRDMRLKSQIGDLTGYVDRPSLGTAMRTPSKETLGATRRVRSPGGNQRPFPTFRIVQVPMRSAG
jgi:hypothetical protein